jgi:hypothetical protein
MSEAVGLSQVELVVKEGNAEKIVVLNKDKFGKRLWKEIEKQAFFHDAFGHGRRLHGSKCFECGKSMVIRIWSKKVGPECVLIRYRCLGCGHEDEDVLD